MVPSGAGLPQGQGIPGISTGHPISSPASLGVGMALPLCAQGFQAPQQTKIYFWLDLWLLLREAGMWPVMPGGNRAGMPEHAAQDTGLCLGAVSRTLLSLHSEVMDGSHWEFLEFSRFQAVPKLLG